MEISDKEFKELASFVYSHCGIYLHEGKREMVKARLSKQMRLKGFTTYRNYIHHVTTDTTGNEVVELINAISTNLTSFFRESRHFDYLKDTLIPELNRRSLANPRLRAWSAGCSTGEEPYTLAMVFLENLASSVKDFKILATDISTRVLHQAMTGVYSEERINTIPSHLAGKYFSKESASMGRAYRANESLRRVVHFARLNLMEPFPLKGPFQVIFCRNVMIYFDQPSREDLVRRFHHLLSPGGHFFVGHSESLTGIAHPFNYVAPSIYRK